MSKATSQNTLTLDLYGEQEQIEIEELSCAQLEILRLHGKGEQGRIIRMLNNKDCKAWFSKNGFTFTVTPFGYDVNRNCYTSRCGRIIESVDDLVNRISKPPYETPYLKEWGPIIWEALEPKHIRPTTGLNPVGKYLSKELLPKYLDDIISSLVKRKILSF